MCWENKKKSANETGYFHELLWKWPNGLVWKFTRRPTVGSRKKKFELFMKEMAPGAGTKILDVGVSGAASGDRAENFLEEWYPHPEHITAVGIGNLKKFEKRYPRVKTIEADATRLPFKDKSFDIVFSNAVIEHVGGHGKQRQFVEECVRVGKRLFITTPARCFPIESHTMIPFVHWLPTPIRNFIYRKLGREHEGTHGNLTLLYAWQFKRLFPTDKINIKQQRFFGLTSVLIAILK